jgi:superfamily II DNA or RNA helicase
VLCPPHLAEQWQDELRSKFHLEAELVLPSTVTRLERNTATGQSLFDLYPFVVVSTDFIKSSRYRDEFVRTCPEFVIVDEAHTCAFANDQRSGRHLRHQLIQALARDERRHLVLVTATPHSGDEGAFRSLLGLLRPEFDQLPEDLTGPERERERRAIAAHLVQRRRADVRDYMEANTPFPAREEAEAAYQLSEEYRKLFDAALAYARERVADRSGDRKQQRVRWWSALALLRSLASSPAAAAATLRARSVTVETEDSQAADEAGERSVLDLDDVDADAYLDVTPGSQEADEEPTTQRERLLRMARRAEALYGPGQDAKLKKAIQLVKDLLAEGYSPILFCRFIATADYVAEELRKALPKSVEVAAVTGTLPPAERELRVQSLGEHPKHMLVATDCLSEGINLQKGFNAVVHYDLSWNPTRHEQREGRVDRYGQPNPTVRTLTYYGTDNQIDGVVLDVLLRKHKTIRSLLGISVPVPGNTNDVVQALMQGLILRGQTPSPRGQLSFADLGDEFAAALHKDFYTQWDNATDKEKRSRTLFAQRTLDVREVAAEWAAMSASIGAGVDVARFMTQTVRHYEGFVAQQGETVTLRLPNVAALREAVGGHETLSARFALPVPNDVLYLSRTHPSVEGLAAYVINAALDPLQQGRARRCGAIRTRAVATRTTLLLLRLRHHITATRREGESQLLAEECLVTGFRGAPDAAVWISEAEAEALLQAEPSGNILPQQAASFVRQVVDGINHLRSELAQLADERAQELLEAHRRVRIASRTVGVRYDVRPQLPVDVLGIFVLLPGAQPSPPP